MKSEAPNVQLLGFEKDAGLSGLFAQFGLYEDYRAMLPEHLLGILRQQHPSVIIETIELLDTPKCNLDGRKQELSSTIIRVQTLDVPLDLRVTVRVGSAHLALDIRLVIKCEGLDSTPTTRSDMFVTAQRAIA
jgi:hypothetical protein